MSLASENLTPMEEDEVTTVTVVGDGDVNGNIIGSASSPPPSRIELYQVICRLIEIGKSSVDTDVNEYRDIWNRIKRLDGYYGTIKSLGARYYSLLYSYNLRYSWRLFMDTAVLDQIRALVNEVFDCVWPEWLAEGSSAIDATINFGMSLKEFVDLMSRVEGAIPFVNSIRNTPPEEAIEIWSNIKKLEEFERSFFPHECRGMVESLRTQFSSKLRDSASGYNFFLMTSSELRSKNNFLALLKEVNGDKDLEETQFATGFVDYARALRYYNFESYGVVPLQQMSMTTGSDMFIRSTEALHLYPPSGGRLQAWPSMSSKEIWTLKDRMSEIKIRYCQMKGGEIGEVRDIWSSIMRLREDDCFYRKYYLNVEVLISEFNSLLKNFISYEMLPKDLSDFSFIEDCRRLLRQVDVYTDLEGAWTSADSLGQASSNGGISTLGDPSHPTLGGNHMSEQDVKLKYFAKFAQWALGGFQMSEQDVKLKSFDKFAQWATALFLAILIGLMTVNAKQAQFLFRMCSSLVFGATISGIGMLLLVLMGHSSRRALSSLKILQYLIIGLLFITTTLVYMFTLRQAASS